MRYQSPLLSYILWENVEEEDVRYQSQLLSYILWENIEKEDVRYQSPLLSYILTTLMKIREGICKQIGEHCEVPFSQIYVKVESGTSQFTL